MSDQIILKSVDSYLDTNGHVGPLDANGLPDMFPGSCVDISEVDTEWVSRLSKEDAEAFAHVSKQTGHSIHIGVALRQVLAS